MQSKASTYLFSLLLLFLIPLSSALQIPPIFAPFYEARFDSLLSNETITPIEQHELLKRQVTCPANYNSCSNLAAADAGACCTAGSICTTDHAKNIACCPTGATCTGTVSIVVATTATETGSSSSGAVLTASSTTVTTSTATGSTATITSAASVVTNAFFPFPYIPTTYINSAACMTAYSDCQSNYAACTAELEGGGFAVTIVAPAGGVTVSPTAQNLGVASATSICSSLYDVACYGIVPSNCNSFGTSFVAGTTTATAAAPARITGGVYAGMMVGVGLGIVGQMI